MAIWRYLIRPALPWLGRLAVAIAASLAVAWVFGTVFMKRAEPEVGDGLPSGVAGRMVVVGGRQVHVVEAGSGDPVVLVHDFAGSTIDWEHAIVPALSRSHRVVALDLLGMGFSARARDLDYGWNLWSRQVLDTMDALGMPRASLVGLGLGAAVAALVAGEHGDRVERLVMVAPRVPVEQSERPWFERLLEIPGVGEMMLGTRDHLPDGPGFRPDHVERMRAIFRREGTRRALLTYVRHGRDTARLAAAYREIFAPTLVVAGTEDDVVPYVAVRKWTPAIRDALLLPIGSAGHWLVRDETDRVVGAIADFLGRAPATSATADRRE
jgi:pimeloyl-ACP methyl ester carboxylesterase